MTIRQHLHSRMIPVDADDEFVERPFPGAAPTAFRIWSYGVNKCDDGDVIFSEQSAELLMLEQESRGRRYSIDFDHLSLRSDRPATSGRASGWHSLEVRKDADGKPELWAVEAEWCADVKAGLEQKPPHWKFFSPAFRSDHGEVTSYVNLALCINPLTHQLPSLAARTAITGETTMKKKAIAALATMMSSEASDEEKKEAAATLKSFLEGEDDKDETKSEDEGDKPEDKQEETAEDGEEKKDEPEAKAAAASMGLAKENLELKARVEALEVKMLLDARTDLSPALSTWCASQPFAVVKSFLANAPKETAKREERPTKTSGEPAVAELGTHAVDKVLGIRATAAGPVGFGAVDPSSHVRILNRVSPSEMRKRNEKKEGR